MEEVPVACAVREKGEICASNVDQLRITEVRRVSLLSNHGLLVFKIEDGGENDVAGRRKRSTKSYGRHRYTPELESAFTTQWNKYPSMAVYPH